MVVYPSTRHANAVQLWWPSEVTIEVRRLSRVVSERDLDDACNAFLQQANGDFHLYWRNAPYVAGFRAVDEFSTVDEKTPPEERPWRVSVFDHAGDALADPWTRKHIDLTALQCIGYHYAEPSSGDTHAGQVPHLVVFAAQSLLAGIPWSVPLSHELLESLADPWAVLTQPVAQPHDPTAPRPPAEYGLEVCDPVQLHAYPIDGVWVSNFVTPMWFGVPPAGAPPAPAGTGADDRRYDFARVLGSPLELAMWGTRTTRVDGQDRTEQLTPAGLTTLSLGS